MRTDQGRGGVARGPVARTAFAPLLVALSVWAWAPTASAQHSRLPVGPHFREFGPSAQTVVAWQAVTHVRGGQFLLLRGPQTGELRVAAVLPAIEGSHRYHYVDLGLAADTETVYQLVYRGTEGAELVLVTARLERLALSATWVAPSPTRDADPGRSANFQCPLPSPALDGPPGAERHQGGAWPEPPSPPPKRSALS